MTRYSDDYDEVYSDGAVPTKPDSDPDSQCALRREPGKASMKVGDKFEVYEDGSVAEVVKGCTCGAGPGGYYGAHEPDCGLEYCGKLEEIMDTAAENFKVLQRIKEYVKDVKDHNAQSLAQSVFDLLPEELQK